MEHIQSFRIEAGGVTKVKPQGNTARTVEIVVVEGGPVYLFEGNVSAARANELAAAGDFDLAASATSGKSERGVSERYGQATLYSDNVSIGYIRTQDKPPK